MITELEFSGINDEVIAAVDKAYETVKVSYKDYIVFLANCEYKENLRKNSLNLNPYCLDDREDMFMDETRIKFLVEFLNAFYTFNTPEKAVKDSEIRLNMELMIYSHVWESVPLLKQLSRLEELAAGYDYPWKVEVPEMGKHKFIRATRDGFKATVPELACIITNGFHTSLRNAFAHSQYSIDENQKRLWLYNYGGEDWEIQELSFNDWSKRFAYTILLAYRIIEIHNRRRKELTIDAGTDAFTISHPSQFSGTNDVEIVYREQFNSFHYKYPTLDEQRANQNKS